MTKRIVDWEAIEREYRAGQLSVNAIAKSHGITEGAIRKKANTQGWGKRDLADAVREKVREKLVRREVRSDNANTEEIIDAASERGAAVIETHRKDINKLREIEQQLLTELGDPDNPPTKLYLAQYQGQVIQQIVGIAVTERASALQALSSVQHKRIQLERQAFNLDEVQRDAGKCMLVVDE